MCTSSHKRKHAAVIVEVGSWKAEIDVTIAPLIREMWIAGIETSMSCEGDETGRIWIEFSDLRYLIKFLNAAARFEAEGNSLYHRMNYVVGNAELSLLWDYGIFPGDTSLIWPDDADEPGAFGHEGLPDFYFTCYVRFPVTDLSIVLEHLRNHNRRTAEGLQSKSIA